MKTVIRLNRLNGKPEEATLDHETATTYDIARVVVELVESSMSMAEGDVITVTVEA
jgi:hypothetical protein